MKNFSRAYPQAALCGLNCLLCPMCVGGYCPGCGGEGSQGCPRARCARDRGITDFCFRCGEYPCGRYAGSGDYDSFVPTRCMEADMERIRTMGPEAYVAELEKKRAILDELLAEWNDGRKKSLYCAAIYLLDLESLRGTVEQVGNCVSGDADRKERASRMAAALQEAAGARNISLKLRKKPKQRQGERV